MVEADDRDVARMALEQVCARGDMTLAPQCYAHDFVDHVGRISFRGLEGVQRSTALYRSRFDDLAFDVVDQVAEGDRVASRWVLTGSYRGRPYGCGASRSVACARDGSSRTGARSTASSCSVRSGSCGRCSPPHGSWDRCGAVQEEVGTNR
jgi:ketosteroid isomerase-like protein